MAAITLSQAFGANAAINAGVLSITLSDLASTGLTPSSTSPAEIFTALILKLQSSQSSTSQDDATVGIYVGTPFNTISRNDTQLERQYPVSIYTPLNITALDPDDVVG